MIRLLLAVGAVIAMAAVPAAKAQSLEEPPQKASGGKASWTWRAAGSHDVVVSLARGDVSIVRSDVRETRLEAFAVDPAGDGSPVTLAVSTGPTEIRIIDRYPTSLLGITRECLPPDSEHGDFWHYEERLRMVLTVPRGVRVSASTMSGSVTGH